VLGGGSPHKVNARRRRRRKQILAIRPMVNPANACALAVASTILSSGTRARRPPAHRRPGSRAHCEAPRAERKARGPPTDSHRGRSRKDSGFPVSGLRPRVALHAVPLYPPPTRRARAEPVPSPPLDPHESPMCTYEGREVLDHGCEHECKGCKWTPTVTSSGDGSTCVFTWSVARTGCTYQTDQTFSGTTSVPCGESTAHTFPCGSDGGCNGYELTLTGAACP